MATQYRCGSDRRRRLVRESMSLNGIDYLVIEPDQATIRVHFLHDLPGSGPGAIPSQPVAGLTAANVLVDGGTRIEPIAVTGVATAGAVLTVTVDRPGDFSEYRLSVVDDDPDRSPLAGFDPQLSAIRFTFKVDCPTGFDCVSDEDCPPGSLDEAEIDYLAKDYASFRRLMLDRMAVVAPDWHERNPADLQVALVELLAFVGDRLSYFQDAVATEAYLGTARRRDSVRRHARLLDYRMHDGCNARTWIHVAVDGGAPVEVPAGTVIVERTDPAQDAILSAPELATVLAREAPIVFETRATITARGAHNEIPLHPWSEIGCCLPIGATRATLRNDAGKPLALAAGECLLFEEIKGPSGEAADADPAHRQVVRLSHVVDARPGQPAGSLTDELDGTHIVEVEWDPRDALTFPLCLSAIADDGTTVNADLSVARGNLVLADHGLKTPVALIPDEAPIGRSFRPILDAGPVACGEAVDPRAAASAALVQDPARALPLVELAGDGATWAPQKDLLGSGPYAAEFVAEVAESGPARLRFGDGASGRRPSEGSTFSAVARIGNGTLGNVGPDTLTRVRWEGGGIAVRNPVAGDRRDGPRVRRLGPAPRAAAPSAARSGPSPRPTMRRSRCVARRSARRRAGSAGPAAGTPRSSRPTGRAARRSTRCSAPASSSTSTCSGWPASISPWTARSTSRWTSSSWSARSQITSPAKSSAGSSMRSRGAASRPASSASSIPTTGRSGSRSSSASCTGR